MMRCPSSDRPGRCARRIRRACRCRLVSMMRGVQPSTSLRRGLRYILVLSQPTTPSLAPPHWSTAFGWRRSRNTDGASRSQVLMRLHSPSWVVHRRLPRQSLKRRDLRRRVARAHLGRNPAALPGSDAAGEPHAPCAIHQSGCGAGVAAQTLVAPIGRKPIAQGLRRGVAGRGRDASPSSRYLHRIEDRHEVGCSLRAIVDHPVGIDRWVALCRWKRVVQVVLGRRPSPTC